MTGPILTLNTGQQNAADEFFRFMIHPTQKEMAISGRAGTGKTFLLQHLFKRVLPDYRDSCKILNIPQIIKDFTFTATTNRAADVLSGSMDFPAMTIHSFMNLKVYDDFKTGRQKLSKTDRFKVHTNMLIFIDEASMVDRKLYKIIHEGTDKTCKIVYVGDHCQLAPVGEEVSQVFDPSIPRVELTQQMRNSGQPALMDLCEQLRETVETGVFKPIKLVPGVIDQLDDTTMQQHVDTVFGHEDPDSRILAYTNNQVLAYNAYIRKIRGYGDRFGSGEAVVNNSGCKIGSNVLSAEREFTVEPLGVDATLTMGDGTEIDYHNIELHDPKNGNVIPCRQPNKPSLFREIQKQYARNKDWFSFYQLKNSFPDLRSRDSSTVYKAQGSTYESVYADMQNIGTCTNPVQASRMLYVALSRAREHVYLYGRLPPRFIGG